MAGQQDLTGKEAKWEKVRRKSQRVYSDADYNRLYEDFRQYTGFDPTQFDSPEDMQQALDRLFKLPAWDNLEGGEDKIIDFATNALADFLEAKGIKEAGKALEKEREIKRRVEEIREPAPQIEEIPITPVKEPTTEPRERTLIGRIVDRMLKGNIFGYRQPKPVPSDYRDIKTKMLEQKETLTGAKEQPDAREVSKGIGFRIQQIMSGIENTAKGLLKRIFG